MKFKLKIAAIFFLLWFSSATSGNSEELGVVPHSITAQVSEGLNLSAFAKVAVTTFYRENGRFPAGNTEAGLPEPYSIHGKYVVSVTVGATRGIISAEFGGDASPEIFGRTIEWKPTIAGGNIVWTCASEYIADLYWPQACKNRNLRTSSE